MLKEKDFDLSWIYSDGMNHANATSGAKSGLQRRQWFFLSVCIKVVQYSTVNSAIFGEAQVL